MSSLLLLTKHFPYNNGDTPAESYLDTEIGLLADAFDEILVLATEARCDAKLISLLPCNVKSKSLGIADSRAAKLLLAAKGIAVPLFGTSLQNEALKADSPATLPQKLYLGYFLEKARCKYEAALKVMREINFDPSCMYSFWLYDAALAQVWLRKSWKCKTSISRAHGYDLYSERNKLNYLPLRDYLVKRLDFILACSEDGKEYLAQKHPSEANKIRTAYLGTRNLPDKSIEVQEGPFRVVSCSRVVSLKRVGMIANALGLLVQQGFELEWTHFGDGPELNAVKEIAQVFGIQASFPGNISNAKLLDEYSLNHFDLFVNASTSEGLPISIMEACGCGVPVVATDVGGTSEIVKNGINGYLIPEDGDAESLATNILSVMGLCEEERQAMRQASRMIWEENFQAQKNIRDIINLLIGED